MTVTVEVPREMVEKARSQLAKTGHPLLLRDRQRRNDAELVAIPVNRGYLLVVGPETHIAQFHVAMHHRYLGRDLRTVGLWEVIEDSVCGRGPVALSCLLCQPPRRLMDCRPED